MSDWDERATIEIARLRAEVETLRQENARLLEAVALADARTNEWVDNATHLAATVEALGARAEQAESDLVTWHTEAMAAGQRVETLRQENARLREQAESDEAEIDRWMKAWDDKDAEYRAARSEAGSGIYTADQSMQADYEADLALEVETLRTRAERAEGLLAEVLNEFPHVRAFLAEATPQPEEAVA